jgi:hypothetical protein
MMLQVGKVGLMILDQRKAKSDIRDLLFKQGMENLTTWWGLRIDESDPHRRCAVSGRGSICTLTWSSGIIWWKKNLWRQLTRPHDRLFNHDDKTRIVIHFWRKMASDDVQLCQQDLEMIILILTSNLTWLWAAVRKYDIDAVGIGFSRRLE